MKFPIQEIETALEAAKILAPLIRDVKEWIEGDGDEPEVLKLLPEELRAEAALKRLRVRQQRNAG